MMHFGIFCNELYKCPDSVVKSLPDKASNLTT